MKILIVLLISFMFFACGNDVPDNENLSDTKEVIEKAVDQAATQAQVVRKKYPLKSGIITYERTGVLGNGKVIVYFDDYGIKERSETYNENGEVDEIKFSDGENMYKIIDNEVEKSVYLMGPGLYGTEMKFEFDPFNGNEKRIQKYNYKPLDNMQILGRDCQVYSMEAASGKSTFGGHDDFLLYTKAETPVGTYETKAVDFKENVDVDAALFKVPEGYKILK